METIILKTQEEIQDFLELKNRFNVHNFTDTNYNAFITMKDVSGWVHRPFHVYFGDDIKDGDLIINGIIHIASMTKLSEKEGIVEFIKSYSDKAVYKIKVSEIEKIELKEILR